MRVASVFFLLLASLSQQSAPPPVRKADATQSVTSKRVEEKQQVGAVAANHRLGEQPDAIAPAGEGKTAQRSFPSPDSLSAYSTVFIAFFTFVTTGAFLYQIRITHNAERAWVSVETIEQPTYLAWVQFPTLDKLRFHYRFRNRGRTQARVVSVKVRFCILGQLGALPENPDYGDGGHTEFQPIPTDGILYPPEGSFDVYAVFEGLEGKKSLTREQMDAVRSHRSVLVSYGRVVYKDAFRRRHETRFCYVYNVEVKPTGEVLGDFYLGGPSLYNRAT